MTNIFNLLNIAQNPAQNHDYFLNMIHVTDSSGGMRLKTLFQRILHYTQCSAKQADAPQIQQYPATT